MASMLAAALLLLVVGAHLASCEDHVSPRSPVIRHKRGVPTTGCYIVAMKDDTSEADLQQVLTKAVKASDDAKVHGLVQKVKKAFTVKLNPYALEMVRHLPGVDYIEEEGFAVGDQDDSILPWQVDRIDQKELPLDYNYSPIGDGHGVDVYILDSGINYDHEEFEYRAKYSGYDPIDEFRITFENIANHSRKNGRDCHGHGTHVASLCGGKTYGSAKKVNIYSVRVLGCNNAAPWRVVLDGLNYVSGVVPERGRPAIVSMSLSGFYHRIANEAVERIVSEGITVVTVAGNGRANSCLRSPGSADSAITVAGSSSEDRLYTGTNYGVCVDIFAPGSRVRGAGINCTACYSYKSGTSMAAPLVSGVAAIHLSQKPKLSPAKVKAALISDSVLDTILYTESVIPRSSWAVTKNRLLQIPGSCGGSGFLLNSSTITSPGYPTNYPPDLNCVWKIAAEEKQFVQFDLFDLHLESKYDVLKVYDGSCPYTDDDESDLVEEFTGFRGLERYTYRTESNVLCLKLVTDGTISFKGFNSTYSKFYNGTDIKDYCRRLGLAPPPPPLPFTIHPSTTRTCVTTAHTPTPTVTPHSPSPPIPSPPPVPDLDTAILPTLPTHLLPRFKADFQFRLRWSARQARNEVADLVAEGYTLLWAAPYWVGPSFPKPYFDVILTNSSDTDTKGFMDITHEVMNQTIYDMKALGYSASTITHRPRGREPKSPSYTAIFTRKNDILETEVFLRDSLQEYRQRLTRMTAEGYRLLSHAFCEIQGQTEVVSVYERDRRLAYNITVPNLVQWQSYYNLTFFKFSEVALQLGRDDYYPYFVQSYRSTDVTNVQHNSLFAAVFVQPIGNNLNWFRWGLERSVASDTITVQLNDGIWEPRISLAYNYLGNMPHFVSFTRRRYEY